MVHSDEVRKFLDLPHMSTVPHNGGGPFLTLNIGHGDVGACGRAPPCAAAPSLTRRLFAKCARAVGCLGALTHDEMLLYFVCSREATDFLCREAHKKTGKLVKVGPDTCFA